MKILILFLIAITPLASFSQSIERQVLASAGKNASTPNLIVNYTVGETEIFKGTGSNIIVTQGYQQYKDVSTGIRDAANEGIQLNVYPNPSHNYVNVDFTLDKTQAINYTLYDINGKLLFAENNFMAYNGLSKQIQVGNLSNGVYFLHFENEEKTISYQVKFEKTK